MMISQQHINSLFEKFKASPHFDNVIDIGLRNSYNKFYIVGGKVYRGLAEVIYGGDFGFENCDWDLLTMGKPVDVWLPMPQNPDKERWSWAEPNYNGNYSKRAKLFKSNSYRELLKIDIISIYDIREVRKKPKEGRATINDYFWGVPLDIQAIAFDLNGCFIKGPGISSILKKTISMNGNISEKNYASYYVENLLREKANSMKFNYDLKLKNKEKKCKCFIDNPRMLLDFGCSCGGV